MVRPDFSSGASPAPVRKSFFFNDTATTEIYTLSLHDALPISTVGRRDAGVLGVEPRAAGQTTGGDRKSTRLNSSHSQISYAVFCLKKKKRRAPTTIVDDACVANAAIDPTSRRDHQSHKYRRGS